MQFVLPGAERISSAELAKRRAAEPLKPKVAQKPLVEGLFGELAKEELPIKPAAAPSKLGIMSRMLAQKQKAEAPSPAAHETGVVPEKTGVVAPERFEVDEAQEIRTDR